jgi:hypothetical protein
MAKVFKSTDTVSSTELRADDTGSQTAKVTLDNGVSAAVSAGGEAALRWNDSTKTIQSSEDGGAWATLADPNAVTAAAVITDHTIVRGNGGARGVQDTGIAISDNDEVRMVGTVEWAKGGDLASAATLTLDDDGNYFDVTGTTTITTISAKPAGTRILLHFDAAVTLTYDATKIVLQGAEDLTTAAGDQVEFVNYDGTNWREVSRSLAAGVGSGELKSAVGYFEQANSVNNYKGTLVTTNGDARVTVHIPDDFSSLVKAHVFGIPQAGAPGVTKDIDVSVSYGANGESITTHIASDTTSTYTVGAVDTHWELDLTALLGSLAAGDTLGTLIKHNVIGGAILWIGIDIEYLST